MDRRIVSRATLQQFSTMSYRLNRCSGLLEAFQQPAQESKPLIRVLFRSIEVKSEVRCFRQERNNEVTVNQFQQKGRQMSQQDEAPEKFVVSRQ